jgi:cytochrome bd-type quinol oxidase subunit 1
MTFVLWLHVLAAIFVIGPLTVAMSAAPRAIKAGAEGLPLLRWLHRTTRYYGLGALLVFATGAWLVPLDKHVSFDTGWLSAAMAMFIVAILLVLFSAREQGKAVKTLEAGNDAAVEGGRMSAIAGFTALIWVAILLLMVFHPGSH